MENADEASTVIDQMFATGHPPPEIELTREELDLARACAGFGTELSRCLACVSAIGVGMYEGRLFRLVEDGNPFFRIHSA